MNDESWLAEWKNIRFNKDLHKVVMIRTLQEMIS